MKPKEIASLQAWIDGFRLVHNLTAMKLLPQVEAFEAGLLETQETKNLLAGI